MHDRYSDAPGSPPRLFPFVRNRERVQRNWILRHCESYGYATGTTIRVALSLYEFVRSCARRPSSCMRT